MWYAWIRKIRLIVLIRESCFFNLIKQKYKHENGVGSSKENPMIFSVIVELEKITNVKKWWMCRDKNNVLYFKSIIANVDRSKIKNPKWNEISIELSIVLDSAKLTYLSFL